VAFREDALANEAALTDHADEFRMRVRVSLRALHALWDLRRMLHPRHGLFAFQLAVHKLLRYLLPLPLVAAFLCSAGLAYSRPYGLLFVLQILCYGLAAAGWLAKGRVRARMVFVPFYFTLLNAAAAAALVRFVRGEQQILWTPRKGA
jgi:hypothetical protein